MEKQNFPIVLLLQIRHKMEAK